MESGHSIHHLSFFSRLGSLKEGTSEWHAARAGLVLLRLVDQRFSVASTGPDPWQFRAVRAAIEAIEETSSVRSILAGALEALTAPNAAPARVLPRLMAYGRALDLGAQWSLARDVYDAIVRHADAAHEADLVVDAYIRIGFCARVESLWDESLSAFLAAGRIADILGDETRSLRVVVARAALAREQGHYTIADDMLAGALKRIQPVGDTRPVYAVALHERAINAHARQRFEQGLHYAYAALELTERANDRDRLLGDIASFFLELGVYSAARDAYLIVATTAHEYWSRWSATINLIELATIQRLEPLFEAHRRELRGVDMPPRLEASYHLYVGRGLIVFGRSAEGRESLRQSLEIALSHDLTDLATEARRSLDEPLAPPYQPSPIDVKDTIHEVAARISAMRVAALQ